MSKAVDCFKLVRLARKCEATSRKVQDLLCLAMDKQEGGKPKPRLAIVSDPGTVAALNGAGAGEINVDPAGVGGREPDAQEVFAAAREWMIRLKAMADQIAEEVS